MMEKSACRIDVRSAVFASWHLPDVGLRAARARTIDCPRGGASFSEMSFCTEGRIGVCRSRLKGGRRFCVEVTLHLPTVGYVWAFGT